MWEGGVLERMTGRIGSDEIRAIEGMGGGVSEGVKGEKVRGSSTV